MSGNLSQLQTWNNYLCITQEWKTPRLASDSQSFSFYSSIFKKKRS